LKNEKTKRKKTNEDMMFLVFFSLDSHFDVVMSAGDDDDDDDDASPLAKFFEHLAANVE